MQTESMNQATANLSLLVYQDISSRRELKLILNFQSGCFVLHFCSNLFHEISVVINTYHYLDIILELFILHDIHT